ncbi:hypothetical protein MCOR25_002400 [Pyricularia grisea]|nr:hypothetical protein MCOR25_002400 [Pyricularia grisea]
MVPLNSCSYAVLSVEEQLNRAADVAKTIEDMLEHIVMSTTEDASFGTKENALETLKRIFETTCLSGGYTAHEMRQICCGWGCRLLDVLDVCSEDELYELPEHEWLREFKQVVELATDLGILDELQEGLDILGGNDDEDEDMGDDTDDDMDD